MFLDNSWIITTKEDKDNILLNRKTLQNIKVYTVKEFCENYYKVSKDALTFIKNKYQVNLDIASIYLDNLFFIKDKDYKNSKLNFLLKIKKDLIANNLLELNINFINCLSDKTIYLYNLEYEKNIHALKKILAKTSNLIVLNDKVENYKHQIYTFENSYIEVAFIAEKICDYIKKNVPLSNIYIVNIDNEYKNIVKMIFKMFNIPVTFKNSSYLSSTYMASEFLKNIEKGIDYSLDKILSLVKTEADEKIYNMILNIVNDYSGYEQSDLKSILEYTFKRTKIKSDDNKISIQEKDLDFNFNDDDYVFIMHFNRESIPKNFKDENYLRNKELEILGLSSVLELNFLHKSKILNKLKSIKNLVITATEKDDISVLNEKLEYEVIPKVDFISKTSNQYNKFNLALNLDLYYKFKTIKPNLNILNSHYKDIGYQSYDNSFKNFKIPTTSLTLSYSSLDKYEHCPFAYYVSKVLKIDKFSKTFSMLVGTIFHTCLEKIDEDINSLVEDVIKNNDYELDERELFFISILKEELVFARNEIKTQKTYTKLVNELHEQKIVVNLSDNVKFMGIIDKVLYLKEADITYLSIIDYKTGEVNTDLSLINYGINMQLSIYLYLIKNSNLFENPEVVGIYLQKVLNKKNICDDYLAEKKQNLLLQGYSTKNIKALEKFDSSYEKSRMIKSLRLKNDGNFYAYSKVMSDKEFNKIYDIALEKIKIGVENILNADFIIEPKKIGNENISCKYCNYKDLCFRKEKDVKILKKIDLEDILEVR